MKKITSVLVCMALFLSSLFLVAAVASSETTVYSEQLLSAEAGTSIKIPIYIGNNTGLMGFRINFEYDSSVLTPVSVEYGEVVDYGLEDNIEGDSVPGSMCVYWAGTEDITVNGIWFYINFSVNESSRGETEISVSYTQADTFNENFEDVVLCCSPIDVSVSNAAYSDNISFSLSAPDFKAGEAFSVCVKADALTDADSVVFEFSFDSDLFEYQGLSVNGVAAKVTANNETLTVTITGSDAQYKGQNILTLNFVSSANTVGGTYRISADVTADGKGVYCSPCSFYVSSGKLSGAVIYTKNNYALPGETVEIPVMIKNNTGIMGFRLTFYYDSGLLTPVSVSKGENLSSGTLNDSIGVDKAGEFSVLWNDTGEFLDNGILLKLTFNVNAEADYSTADIGVSYSQRDTFDEEYKDVSLICEDIDFAITNCIPVSENTLIKPTEKYLYSEENGCNDLSKLLNCINGYTVSGKPNSDGFYGTGTTATVKDSSGSVIETYTVIIAGDVNGDSVSDVLDVTSTEKAINGKSNLIGSSLEAGDLNNNDYIDVNDYQSMVNYILSK